MQISRQAHPFVVLIDKYNMIFIKSDTVFVVSQASFVESVLLVTFTGESRGLG